MNLLDVILIAGIGLLFFNPVVGLILIFGSLVLADHG